MDEVEMWLKNLFKSRHAREWEDNKKKADVERAKDLLEDASRQVIAIIDRFFEERASDAGIRMMQVLKDRMLTTHKATEQDVIAEFHIFHEQKRKYVDNIKEECRNSLGEWKYTLIASGMMDLAEKYIDTQMSEIVKAMDKGAQHEAMWAFARVQGIISDGEQEMTPEQLSEHLKEKHKNNPNLKAWNSDI